MKTPHKHRDLIIAWAFGAEIEVKTYNAWTLLSNPRWDSDSAEYRIKPETKPDVVGVWYVDDMCCPLRCDNGNLKLTFDGETRKLKSAEVIS